MKYKTVFRLTASATDSGVGASVLGVASIVQDNICAFFATVKKDNLNLSEKYGAVWVFVKNRFKKYSVVYWNEEITVESFISKRTSATIIVDTAIRKGDGSIAYYARTEACAIDIKAQRIIKIASVELPESLGVYESEVDFAFNRLEPIEGAQELFSVKVPSTSIDYCKHLNNVEYLRFIFNGFSSEHNAAHVPVEVEIHYVSQSKENDFIKIAGVTEGNEDRIEVVNGGKVSARCRIVRT